MAAVGVVVVVWAGGTDQRRLTASVNAVGFVFVGVLLVLIVAAEEETAADVVTVVVVIVGVVA